MKHRLSFASFNIIAENIIEVVVDEGALVTIEMIDESYEFVQQNMQQSFGLLINQINDYNYTLEAKLSLASYENMKAIAFVYYNEQGKNSALALQKLRAIDDWNVDNFSGLQLGWQQANKWLAAELNLLPVS